MRTRIFYTLLGMVMVGSLVLGVCVFAQDTLKPITVPKTVYAFDYVYKATIVKVKDGDTLQVDVDLGFDVVLKGIDIRLLNIYAPETFRPKTPEEKEAGLKVKKFLTDRLPIGKEIILKTQKDTKEKYGRYLGVINDENGDVNAAILEFMTSHKIKSNKK